MGNLHKFLPTDSLTQSEDTSGQNIDFVTPERQTETQAHREDFKPPSGGPNVIPNYYEGEVQSKTLTEHRKKFFKNSDDQPDTDEEGRPKKKRKKFRLLDKPQDNGDEVFSDNSNPTVAKLMVDGVDLGSDWVINKFTQYTVTDTPDLVSKRDALSASLAELFDQWGWKLSKEGKVLMLLGVYCSAKSRHITKDTTKSSTNTTTVKETKVVDISAAQTNTGAPTTGGNNKGLAGAN